MKLDANVRRYLMAWGLVGMAFEGGIYSVIFNLYLLRLGYGTDMIGLINGVGLFVFAGMGIPAGIISRRFGNRRTFTMGIIVLALSAVVILMAEQFQENVQLGLLIVAGVLRNIGFVSALVSSGPLIMDNTTGRQHAKVFSYSAASFGGLAFFGSLLGGFLPQVAANYLGLTLDDSAPYRLMFWLIIMMMIPAIVILTRMTDQNLRQQVGSGIAASFKLKDIPRPVLSFIVVLMAAGFFSGAAISLPISYYNVYFDTGLGIAVWLIGVISAAARLLGSLGSLTAPRLIERWGADQTVVRVLAIVAIFFFPIGFSGNWVIAAGAYLVIMVANNIRFTAYRTLIMEAVPPEFQQAISGAVFAAIGFSFAVVTVISGYVVGEVGFQMLFNIGGLLMAFSTALLWLYTNYFWQRDLPIAVVAD